MDKTLHHHMCLLNHHPPFDPPVLILLSSPLVHNAKDVKLPLGSVRNAIYSILKPGGQSGGGQARNSGGARFCPSTVVWNGSGTVLARANVVELGTRAGALQALVQTIVQALVQAIEQALVKVFVNGG